MACSRRELLTEARALDDTARNVVNFRTAQLFARANLFTQEFDSRITRAAHNLEDARVLFRHGLADEACPRLIRVNRAGFLQFCPDIKQDEIAALNRRVSCRRWP